MIPLIGNYIYVVKPQDTSLPEGERLFKQPSLERLQGGVQGHLEIVPQFNKINGRNCVVFCNEEGKLHHLLPNPLAHALWEQAVGRIIREDHLVGNIVIIVGEPSFLRQL